MDLTVKTPPVGTVISLDLLKQNKRILHSSEDILLAECIKAAQDYVEKSINCSILQQTLVIRLAAVLPAVYLPRPSTTFAASTISSVKYTLKGEAQVTLTTDQFTVGKDQMLTYIKPADITEVKEGSMEIEYVAGEADEADVPASIARAILLLASHYATSREATFEDQRIMNVEKKIQFGVDALLKNYRVPNVDLLNMGY